MTNKPAKKTNIGAALAVSLVLHLFAFGVAAAVQSKMQTRVIKDYIPVELVQLDSLPRAAVSAPASNNRAAAPIQREAPAPVVKKDNAEPVPVPVSNPSPRQQPESSAPPSGSLLQPGSPAVAGGGSAGNLPSTSPPGGAFQPQSRSKGSYQQFHRLTRLPSFRLRAEPVYPNTERMTGSEARVLAEIYLDERGAVDSVIIKKSGGRLFDRAVTDAARQSSFHPGFMGEKAVPCVIQIPYSFKLK